MWSVFVKSLAVRCLSNLVNVPRKCSERRKQLISSNFQNGTFEIITITMTKIVLIQVFFFTVASKHKNENMEYHGTFISFKSQLYSKPGSPVFSGVWVMELNINSLGQKKKRSCFQKLAGWIFFYHSPAHIVECLSEYIFLISNKTKKQNNKKSKRNERRKENICGKSKGGTWWERDEVNNRFNSKATTCVL